MEDEDPEIKKEDEALEIENQVVDEEELKKEASKPSVELELVEMLRKYKKVIGWTIADIQGINPAIYMHKILLEENIKPLVQPQRKLNKNLEEIVHKEIIKRLNDATRKDHFPLSFIDQMLEKVVGHGFYYFLDGYSDYNQIPIALEDVEKTTFTCPTGIFA
ncbi:uncharacterized protein LOC142178172 [Nicotiana tabacum]|uniref:Uncharacterized protein LOC142178172 n=1 Tax=Nicotiana tabacum TaxID=4097 RepID=A0AC58U2A5_TOBAC